MYDRRNPQAYLEGMRLVSIHWRIDRAPYSEPRARNFDGYQPAICAVHSEGHVELPRLVAGDRYVVIDHPDVCAKDGVPVLVND